MRLDKLLTEAGYGSRNTIKRLLKGHRVKVDDVVVTAPNLNVDPGLQHISVSGERVYCEPERYYMVNKPSGVVTARHDAEHQTVIDLIAMEDRVDGLYPVGRLDRDTEGLVLVTTNGPLGFRMLHPKHHVNKTYYVEVNGYLDVDAPSFFADGVRFHDGTICQSAQLEMISSGIAMSRANITISEGKFHQVKKMFLAYGVKVTYLKRLSFGVFRLDEQLPKGAYRPLTDTEKQYLKEYFD